MDFFNISIYSVISFVCFIPAIVIHEVSHGFVAYKLGDPTAKSKGRLSLNPVAHVDLFGTIILPVMLAFAGGPVFGYAKPVPYNPSYFKNIRKGEFLTGMAGPASNIIMAIIGVIVAYVVPMLMTTTPAFLGTQPAAVGMVARFGAIEPVTPGDWIVMACYFFTMVNLCLAFFNLIPLPQLDGSSIIALFLTGRALRQYYRIQRHSLIILLILLFLVPMIFNVSIIGIYLDATAGNLTRLAFGM